MIERHVDVLKPQSPRQSLKRELQSTQPQQFVLNKRPKEYDLSMANAEGGKTDEDTDLLSEEEILRSGQVILTK